MPPPMVVREIRSISIGGDAERERKPDVPPKLPAKPVFKVQSKGNLDDRTPSESATTCDRWKGVRQVRSLSTLKTKTPDDRPEVPPKDVQIPRSRPAASEVVPHGRLPLPGTSTGLRKARSHWNMRAEAQHSVLREAPPKPMQQRPSQAFLKDGRSAADRTKHEPLLPAAQKPRSKPVPAAVEPSRGILQQVVRKARSKSSLKTAPTPTHAEDDAHKIVHKARSKPLLLVRSTPPATPRLAPPHSPRTPLPLSSREAPAIRRRDFYSPPPPPSATFSPERIPKSQVPQVPSGPHPPAMARPERPGKPVRELRGMGLF
ncbi:hypothetical protein MBLNU230_g6348t1 [Neophaeotheca triangularis]